jgi:hypothetical protein
MSLTGRYLESYEFAVRTHVNRNVLPNDVSLAQRYPKLTLLALSREFNAKIAYDIILAKQRAESGEDMFEATAEIGKTLAERYVYSRDPTLRPSTEQFEVAKEELRKKQLEDDNE